MIATELNPANEQAQVAAQEMDRAKAARLAEVGAEVARRRMDPLALYEPFPEQEAFHASMASERLLLGGNRAGKSVAGYIETARCALGRDPYKKFPTNRPLLVWLISYDEGQIGRTTHRLLFRPGAFRLIQDLDTGLWRAFRPWQDEDRETETRQAPPLIPERYAPPSSFSWRKLGPRIFEVCRLKFPKHHPMDGTEIWAFPSGGEPPTGDPVDLIHIDEDLKFARHVAEFQSRLSDHKGRLIWTARPHMTNTALIRMSKRAEEQEDRPKPDVQQFRLVYSKNPHIDADEKRKRLEGWSEVERRARDLGEFLFDTVLMYPSFHIDTHGVPARREEDRTALDDLLAKRQVPNNATRYMIVDPGHTVCAVLFAFVPPPVYGDVVVAYDELYLKQCDAVKFAKAVETKVAGHHFHAFIIDDHGSRVTGAGSGLTIRYQYSEELRKRKIRSKVTGHGFIKGSDDVLGRAMEVRNWLTRRSDGTTRFRIMRDALPNMIHEFGSYRKRVAADEMLDKALQSNDHLMNCLEYFAAYNPRYHAPPRFQPSQSPVLVEFRKWQKSPDFQSDEDRFLHGPAGGSVYLGAGTGV